MGPAEGAIAPSAPAWLATDLVSGHLSVGTNCVWRDSDSTKVSRNGGLRGAEFGLGGSKLPG